MRRCRAFGDYECPENVRVVDFRGVHGGCALIHVHVQCPGQRARAARGANQGASHRKSKQKPSNNTVKDKGFLKKNTYKSHMGACVVYGCSPVLGALPVPHRKE